MKTPMQTLSEFCKVRAKESRSSSVRRSLMGIVSVINATCIEPEKQVIIDAYKNALGTGRILKDGGQEQAEQYYNKTFKK